MYTTCYARILKHTVQYKNGTLYFFIGKLILLPVNNMKRCVQSVCSTLGHTCISYSVQYYVYRTRKHHFCAYLIERISKVYITLLIDVFQKLALFYFLLFSIFL